MVKKCITIDSVLYVCARGLLSAKSLLGTIRRSDNTLSVGLVVNYLFKRFKRFVFLSLQISQRFFQGWFFWWSPDILGRIQPLHLFIVCLVISLFSVVPRGVFWFFAEDQVLSCKKYWWSNLLLINNLLTITDIVWLIWLIRRFVWLQHI